MKTGLVALLIASGAAPSPVALPGGQDGIGFDDLRWSEALHRVLVPGGRTGLLDLVDPRTGAVESVAGFGRAPSPSRGHEDGTTSADAGPGWIFAIDRTEKVLAVVDPAARRIVTRTALEGGPDYVRWVGAVNEVWVTEPGRKVIETFRVERGSPPRLTRTGTISVPGGPEALAVDAVRRRAYTNTFQDETVSIDLDARTIAARWPNGCRGARGIELDAARGLAFVGCEEGKAVSLDVAHGGKVAGVARTGDGVDGIAYSARLAHLYVPAADRANLTVIGVGGRGELEPLGTLPTAPDAHCAAADDAAGVYVCDPAQGRLLVLRDPYPASPAARPATQPAPAATPGAPAPPVPTLRETITPSKDFPKGTATPSVECGACHQAIYREYAGGFGSDMRYPGQTLRAKGDQVLELPAGTSVSASAHAVSGQDPWPIHAREAEEEGKKCNVCHFPQPFSIPDRASAEIAKPAPRPESQGEGITCAACHLGTDGKIRGPHAVQAPHETVADERMQSSEMCAYCHAMGKRVAGKQTQTYLEWREDFFRPGLGKQQCQDCHMPRTQRKVAEDVDVPVRAVARHLWTGGHSGQRLGSALSMVVLQPRRDEPRLELHVVNVGAGHSVPTGSNRRGIWLQVRALDGKGKQVATREWLFAPWYGPRPDDRAFLKEDEQRPDRIAATQADEQGPHEAPIRAGEERVLGWDPELKPGAYTVEAVMVYDLNRYNDRSFKEDQREIGRLAMPLRVKPR